MIMDNGFSVIGAMCGGECQMRLGGLYRRIRDRNGTAKMPRGN